MNGLLGENKDNILFMLNESYIEAKLKEITSEFLINKLEKDEFL